MDAPLIWVWLKIQELGLHGFSLWFHLASCHCCTFSHSHLDANAKGIASLQHLDLGAPARPSPPSRPPCRASRPGAQCISDGPWNCRRPASRSRSPKLKLASGDKVCSRKGGKPRLRSKLSKCMPNNQQVMCIRTRLTHAQPPKLPGSQPRQSCSFLAVFTWHQNHRMPHMYKWRSTQSSLGFASRSPEPGPERAGGVQTSRGYRLSALGSPGPPIESQAVEVATRKNESRKRERRPTRKKPLVG